MNYLEHSQIIFMLQVLKIGSCLEIFIVCLHLALSNLEVPSFLFSVSMEKAMGE